MRALITGGCGFLGKRLCTLLDAQHIRVATLDNLDRLCGGTGEPEFKTDVTDFFAFERVVRGWKPTVIFHLAAYGRNLTCRDHPSRAHSVNVQGSENALNIARREHIRIVVCSSNITLSDVQTVYRTTKRYCEGLVRSYAAGGCDCLCLRPSNMYGPGQSKLEYQPCAFAGMDACYESSGHVKITGDGTQTRDWVHADDAARAFLLAADSPVRGQTFDVCSGQQVSLNDICAILGVPVVYTSPRPGDAKALVSDPLPAKQHLGFEATLKLQDRIWDAFPSVRKLGVHV